MFLVDWNVFCYGDLHIFDRVQKTHQSPCLLCDNRYDPRNIHLIMRVISPADEALGNTLCNIATLMSQSGVRQGKNSHLCQFQGFLIQMFLPADALWNLAMAINVYLTLFRKYNSQQLKALEWRYHLMAYGAPFIVALAYVFVETKNKGHIYGPATVRYSNSPAY